MINESYALTIDFGTQSVRALIFNKKGETLAIEKFVYTPAYFSLKPGYCEQNAEYYYEKMCAVTNALAKKNPVPKSTAKKVKDNKKDNKNLLKSIPPKTAKIAQTTDAK